jgi:hypothetical protein
VRWLAVAVLAVGSEALARPCPDGPPCPPETYSEGGGFFVGFELSSVIEVTSGAESRVTNVSLASAHFTLSHGFQHVRYFGALDVALGATLADDGFAADLAFLPIGVGLQLRRPERTAFVGVATGIGVSGAYGALPTVAVVPLQLVSLVRVSEKLNVMARARTSWFLNQTSRAEASSLWDELDGMVAVQFSRSHNYLEGNYVGAAYRELDGARFVGLVFGTGGGEEVLLE